MSDENTVQLGYQELEDHNLLMQLIRKQIDRMDDLQMQYETGSVTVHNESDTAHADIRKSVSGIQDYLAELLTGKLAPIPGDNIVSICEKAWTED